MATEGPIGLEALNSKAWTHFREVISKDGGEVAFYEGPFADGTTPLGHVGNA